MTKPQDTHATPSTQPTPGGQGALTWRTAYPGEWKHDRGYIWSDSLKGGQATPAMVRGWGYLTGGGGGALGLAEADAMRIQNEVGNLIASAPDLLEAAREGLLIAEADVESARQDCIEHGEDPDADQFVKVFTERRDLILAAISKATGQ